MSSQAVEAGQCSTSLRPMNWPHYVSSGDKLIRPNAVLKQSTAAESIGARPPVSIRKEVNPASDYSFWEQGQFELTPARTRSTPHLQTRHQFLDSALTI